MNRSFFFVYFTLFLSLYSLAQTKTITYKESEEDFPNPERGFYIPAGTKASHFVLLNVDTLSTYRSAPHTSPKANYTVNITLLYRSYELDTFKNQPLSREFLDNLQKDFDVVRKAGLKMILRFAYTNTAKSGDCPDEYKICPPYGDARPDVVMKHIGQLKPLLHANADVIAVLQGGFIGIWGENYFTDYFGDASMNGPGKILDSSWVLRNQLLKALLNALPADRMVQVRTPQIKQKYVYGPHADVKSATLSLKEAYNGSDKSRIAFHNDCFLASEDDYGTFYDYGSSIQARQPANKALRKYVEEDSKYVAVGGETCDDAYSPQNDCGPVGIAEKQMAAMHYSYLNSNYNNDVNNDWETGGCMMDIKKKLGYRFVLRQAVLPAQAKAGKEMQVKIMLENVGFAAPFNPRPVQLILRDVQAGNVYLITLKTDIRYWFPGAVEINEIVSMPGDLPTGKYELLLNLPDKYESLSHTAAYSIMLANENCREDKTGFNRLDHVISVGK